MMKIPRIACILAIAAIITGSLSCGKSAGEKGTLIAADAYMRLRLMKVIMEKGSVSLVILHWTEILLPGVTVQPC